MYFIFNSKVYEMKIQHFGTSAHVTQFIGSISTTLRPQ